MPAPAPNFVARTLDAIIASLAPSWALRRARSRGALRLAYEAARHDRTRIRARVGSADADLLPDLHDLRQKSRRLVRDDAHAAAALDVRLENVVGAGLKVQADVRPEAAGITQAQADEFNAAAERVWERWCVDQCDAAELADFDELTRQVYRSRLLDGEAFVHRVTVAGRPISTAWELVDPDRVDERHVDLGRDIRGGIELGTNGEPIAYWIQPHHDDDLRFLPVDNNLPERVLRRSGELWNLLHVFRRRRPGQTRGEPWIVPALPLFEHLHHYLDSEIIAARVNANFAVFIERQVDPTSDPNLALELTDAGSGGASYQWHETVDPGTIEYLNPGEKISSFAHNRPGTTFDPFVTRVLRAISAALGLPYEMVVKDFGAMNYSSARVALLEARRGFELEQSLLIAQWLRPVWQTVIREAMSSSLVPQFPQALRDPAPFLQARWIRPAWGWVDPVKEVESSRLAIENNLSTPDREAARAGMDIVDIYRAKARAMVARREIERANGLPDGALDTSAGLKQAPAPTPEPEQDPETT